MNGERAQSAKKHNLPVARGVLELDNPPNVEVLNKGLLKKSASQIKSFLLSPTSTPIIKQTGESWFPAETGSPSNTTTTTTTKANTITTSTTTDKRFIDAQRERRSMQQSVQGLYNRILLLEKEERDALVSANIMRKETERIFTSQAQHRQRKALDRSVQASHDFLISKKYTSNTITRENSQQKLETVLSKSIASIKAKADKMKEIQQKKKQNLLENNAATSLSNQAAFSTVRSFEKSSLFKRILNSEQVRQEGLHNHNLRAQAEISIRKDKAEELERLQSTEREILQRITVRQTRLQQAISDMVEVINVPITSILGLPQAQDHAKMKNTFVKRISGSQQKHLTQISEDLIDKAQRSSDRTNSLLRMKEFGQQQLQQRIFPHEAGATQSTARSSSLGIINNNFNTERFTTSNEVMHSEFPVTEEDAYTPMNARGNGGMRKFNSTASFQQDNIQSNTDTRYSLSNIMIGQDTTTTATTKVKSKIVTGRVSKNLRVGSAVATRPSSNFSNVSPKSSMMITSMFSPIQKTFNEY